jgi:LysM repeat protein
VVDGPPDQVTHQGNHKHIVHTLVTGDSLWTLSQRYGVSVDDLKKVNHLRKKAVLHPGSTLVVDVASSD